MPMNEETKRRLAEYHQAKRAKVIKPKDLEEVDWRMGADWAQENPIVGETRKGYLRYVPTIIVDLLYPIIGNGTEQIWSGPDKPMRVIKAFPVALLIPLLKFLHLDTDKYLRWIGVRNGIRTGNKIGNKIKW